MRTSFTYHFQNSTAGISLKNGHIRDNYIHVFVPRARTMSKYWENPASALEHLQSIIEEIPCSVSSEDTKQLVPVLGKNAEEITIQLNATIVSSLKNGLEEAWNALEVENKLKAAKHLKQSQSTQFRPLPDVLVSSIRGKYLKHVEEVLRRKVQAVREENHNLEEKLQKMCDTMAKQMEEVKHSNVII